MSTLRTAFVTGANRGLGLGTTLELARLGHTVFAASRTREGCEDIMHAAHQAGVADQVRVLVLDVSQPPSDIAIAALQGCDILINNAGVGADVGRPEPSSVLAMDIDELKKALDTNAWGAQRLMSLAIPGMRARGYGRIVNVTSARASLGQWSGDTMAPVYRLSKLMLNGITALAGVELADTNVLVNALCPGWCQTRMGGPQAHEPISAGVTRILRLAFLPQGGAQGTYFINDEPALF